MCGQRCEVAGTSSFLRLVTISCSTVLLHHTSARPVHPSPPKTHPTRLHTPPCVHNFMWKHEGAHISRVPPWGDHLRSRYSCRACCASGSKQCCAEPVSALVSSTTISIFRWKGRTSPWGRVPCCCQVRLVLWAATPPHPWLAAQNRRVNFVSAQPCLDQHPLSAVCCAGVASGWPALQLWRGPAGLCRLKELAGSARIQAGLGYDVMLKAPAAACSVRVTSAGGQRQRQRCVRPLALPCTTLLHAGDDLPR